MMFYNLFLIKRFDADRFQNLAGFYYHELNICPIYIRYSRIPLTDRCTASFIVLGFELSTIFLSFLEIEYDVGV